MLVLMAPRSLAQHLGHLPLFPLPDAVLFPTMRLPLHIFEPRYRQMVRDAKRQGLPIAIGHMKIMPDAGPGPVVVHPVVGAGFIDSLEELPDGRFLIVLLGEARVLIREEKETPHPYRVVAGDPVLDLEISSEETRRVLEEVRRVILAIHHSDPLIGSTLSAAIAEQTGVGEVADTLAGLIHADPVLRQQWLEERNPAARLHAVTEALETMLALSRSRETATN